MRTTLFYCMAKPIIVVSLCNMCILGPGKCSVGKSNTDMSKSLKLGLNL